MKTNSKKVKSLFGLHLLLLMYSLGGIFSKLAAGQAFLSIKFVLCYGVVLVNLFVYAILWQQILKRLPLVTAYANKAITVIWGLIWGMVFFDEQITVQKVIGAIVIIVGVYFVVSDKEEE